VRFVFTLVATEFFLDPTFDVLCAVKALFGFIVELNPPLADLVQQCVNLKAVAVVCQQRFSAHSLVRTRTVNLTQSLTAHAITVSTP